MFTMMSMTLVIKVLVKLYTNILTFKQYSAFLSEYHKVLYSSNLDCKGNYAPSEALTKFLLILGEWFYIIHL